MAENVGGMKSSNEGKTFSCYKNSKIRNCKNKKMNYPWFKPFNTASEITKKIPIFLRKNKNTMSHRPQIRKTIKKNTKSKACHTNY